MNTNAEVVTSTSRKKSIGSRTSTTEKTRPNSCAKVAGPRRQGNVGMSTNADVVNSTNRVRSTGSRTSTIGTRPSSCAKAAGPRRQSSANASIHVAPARSKSPATTTGPKTSTTEPLRSNLYAKDAGPRHQRNADRGSRVKRVAKARGLSSHKVASECKRTCPLSF